MKVGSTHDVHINKKKKASKLFDAHKIEFGGFAIFPNNIIFKVIFWRGKVREESTPN